MKYDLERFVKAQDKFYDIAYFEIRNGKKESHWMWFIFPQIQGLGRSDIAVYYSIDSLGEAKEYMSHPVLGKRLIDISNELLKHDSDINTILGEVDSLKLNSSMTLFSLVSDDKVFDRVIDKFYEGKKDDITLDIVKEKSLRR